MTTVQSDAIPFDIPETEKCNKSEEDEKKSEEAKDKKKDKSKTEKKKTKEIEDDSDSETSTSSEEFCFPKKSSSRTVISINRGKNIQIGDNFEFTQINTNVSQFNASNSSKIRRDYQYKKSEERKLPDDLINSTRLINTDDMYVVAEEISSNWKKLARFLPPGGNFTDGQLKTFAVNNPNNLQEAIIDMLTKWNDEFPDYATLGNLAKTLHEIKRSDIALKLKY